jgi:hypothetical protein
MELTNELLEVGIWNLIIIHIVNKLPTVTGVAMVRKCTTNLAQIKSVLKKYQLILNTETTRMLPTYNWNQQKCHSSRVIYCSRDCAENHDWDHLSLSQLRLTAQDCNTQDTRWSSVVSFTLRPFYLRWKIPAIHIHIYMCVCVCVNERSWDWLAIRTEMSDITI